MNNFTPLSSNIYSENNGRDNINKAALVEPKKTTSPAVNKCGVCASPHHGTHFGILSCRACASFFRRTITERKTYSCRKRNNCDILKPSAENTSVQTLPSIPSSYGSFNTLVFDLNVETPMLDKYVYGLHNFISGQRSIFLLRYPETMFHVSMHKLNTKEEFMLLERGSVSLLNTLICTYVPEFNKVPNHDRVIILKDYSPLFFHLYRCFLTILEYPNETPITKLVCHAGCYVDKETVRRVFFEDTKEHVNFVNELMNRNFALYAKFRALQLSEKEIVSLLAILFITSVERCNVKLDELRYIRDTVFIELHNTCLKRFGLEAPIRYGQLFFFLQEITAMVTELKESMTVAKIFLTSIPDIWEETIDEAFTSTFVNKLMNF